MQLAGPLPPVLPPAYQYVKEHGDVLRQFGATSAEATDSMTIEMTYHSNAKAVNADALLTDTFRGAKLVVDNQSMTTDAPTVTPAGIADILEGVKGLEVTSAIGRDGQTWIEASTPDAALAKLVSDLVEAKPASDINVQISHRGQPSVGV